MIHTLTTALQPSFDQITTFSFTAMLAPYSSIARTGREMLNAEKLNDHNRDHHMENKSENWITDEKEKKIKTLLWKDNQASSRDPKRLNSMVKRKNKNNDEWKLFCAEQRGQWWLIQYRHCKNQATETRNKTKTSGSAKMNTNMKKKRKSWNKWM